MGSSSYTSNSLPSKQGHLGKPQKKVLFLAGHSAKALTPFPLAVSGTRDFMQVLFIYGQIYVFEPAKPGTEIGIKKKSKMSPEKIHVQRKLENRKRPFMKYTRITQSEGGYLTCSLRSIMNIILKHQECLFVYNIYIRASTALYAIICE